MGISKSTFKDIKWVLTEYGEFPSFYSDNACRIISDKYFTKGENSWFQVVKRVADTIAVSGWDQGYFDDKGEMEYFARKVGGGMLRQEFMFNSPVLFNVGVEEEPQCSACFIQGVEDTMESILSLASKEGMLFKYGSGTGTNFSNLRGATAPLSSGGQASGTIEFMKMFDAGAGVIKSGGKTRRAAKMVILNHDHPDISEFIRCKADEEQLVKDGLPLDRAWFQNGNNTVRVTDTFMDLALAGFGHPEQGTLKAMAQAAWECGDPGIQFHDTINGAMPKGLVCNASNPCGEFMFIDDSACNLASLNLVKCPPSSERFKTTVALLIEAMDIIVDMASYPSGTIKENSRIYRPLGLGYTNLGAYLMNKGIAYGSAAACDETEEITKTMLIYAEKESARLADRLGAYPGGELRNAQLTLLAPTGTISFAMDCESTGIEPVFAEESHKALVGGGTIVSVPQCIRDAEARGDKVAIKVALSTDKDREVTPLAHLEMMAAAQKYLSGAISKTVNMPSDCTVDDIFEVYVGAWQLDLKGVAVFRDGCKTTQPMTAKPNKGDTPKSIGLKDVPYLTALLPDESTEEPNGRTAPNSNNPAEEAVFAESAAYSTLTDEANIMAGEMANFSWRHEPSRVPVSDEFAANVGKGLRRKLPTSRQSVTHKFSLSGTVGYLTVGMFPDGTPGELFITINKVGSTIRGMVDSWAILMSMSLQYGVPLQKLVSKFRGAKFEPSGFTGEDEIKHATSIVDYVVQYLDLSFGSERPSDDADSESSPVSGQTRCPECGMSMIQTGSCRTCPACGHSLGGCG